MSRKPFLPAFLVRLNIANDVSTDLAQFIVAEQISPVVGVKNFRDGNATLIDGLFDKLRIVRDVRKRCHQYPVFPRLSR
jgi:hypothetical protein